MTNGTMTGNVDENASPKAIGVALRNLVYFDRLFREDLTGNDSGNTRTHISARVESDNEKYGMKLPAGKQLINVKKMFISLGAVFREKANDEPGRGSCYEYANRDAPLLWLSDAIGDIRNEMKKKAVGEKISRKEAAQTAHSEPHEVWKKMYIKQLMGLKSANDADSVRFNENMSLIGLDHFGTLLNYVVDKVPIEISYVPFKGGPRRVKVYPYFLKNYNQRWFLIGRTVNERPDERHPDRFYTKLSFYALDRIRSLETDDGKVRVPAIRPCNGLEWVENDVDFDEYFYNVIGITDTGDIQDTVLRFSPERYDYVRTKKMLPCQQEIQPGEEYYDSERPTIRMKVMQNRELLQQILAYGADVEVIKPESLREKVTGIVRKMYERYDNTGI